MTKTRLAQARANVTNFDRSLAWYTEIVGFEASLLYPTDAPNYAQFAVADGSVFSIGAGGPVGGRFNFTVDDVDGLWEQLNERTELDVIEELFTAPWGTRKFTIRDPDGNELGFIMPAEENP